MTDEDRRIAQEYLALDEKGKETYLENHGVVILEEIKEEDGGVRWKMDISDEYHRVMEEYQKKHNLTTIDEALSKLLEDWVSTKVEDADQTE